MQHVRIPLVLFGGAWRSSVCGYVCMRVDAGWAEDSGVTHGDSDQGGCRLLRAPPVCKPTLMPTPYLEQVRDDGQAARGVRQRHVDALGQPPPHRVVQLLTWASVKREEHLAKRQGFRVKETHTPVYARGQGNRVCGQGSGVRTSVQLCRGPPMQCTTILENAGWVPRGCTLELVRGVCAILQAQPEGRSVSPLHSALTCHPSTVRSRVHWQVRATPRPRASIALTLTVRSHVQQHVQAGPCTPFYPEYLILSASRRGAPTCGLFVAPTTTTRSLPAPPTPSNCTRNSVNSRRLASPSPWRPLEEWGG